MKRALVPTQRLASLPFFVAAVLPVLALAKASTASSRCLDNAKQLGAALAMYASEHDDALPRTDDYRPLPLGGARRINGSRTVQPYVKSEGAFRCPSDPYRLPVLVNDGHRDAQAAVQSYIPNLAVMPSHEDFLPSVKTSAVGDPMRVIMIAERQAKLGPKVLKAYTGVSAFLPSLPAPGQTVPPDHPRRAQGGARRAFGPADQPGPRRLDPPRGRVELRVRRRPRQNAPHGGDAGPQAAVVGRVFLPHRRGDSSALRRDRGIGFPATPEGAPPPKASEATAFRGGAPSRAGSVQS